jgi:hypothetical protein
MGKMANLPDVSNVDPNAGVYPVVPKGQYTIAIIDSELKPTNRGDGQYLRLFPEILQGQFAGKIRPVDLNLWNNNEQTVQIAQRQLAQICHATNTIGARDSAQFHHKAMLAEIDIEPPSTGQDGRSYPEKNVIRRFMSITGAPALAQEGQTLAPAATPAAANTPPWRRSGA